MSPPSQRLALLGALVAMVWARTAVAQNIGETGTSAAEGRPAPAVRPSPEGPAPGSYPGGMPGPGTTVTTTYRPLGLPAPGTDVNGYLPSSSRGSMDTSRSSDGFDFATGGGSEGTVRGASDAPGVLHPRPMTVPAVHRVKKGDTLWEVCDSYFQNPWLWPKIWSQNPQIQNPHWIYPGDELRLLGGGGEGAFGGGEPLSPLGGPGGKGAGPGPGGGPGEGGGSGPRRGQRLFSGQKPRVSRDTIFLRGVGYIDDPKKEVWGQIAGSQEEQMLLTEGNTVYMLMRPGAELAPGQSLTVFHPVRTPAKVPGARRPPGDIIAFKGTVKIDEWNPKTRMARGRLVESLDTVERGDKVGPVQRAFDVVPARRSEVDLTARILTSLYPHEVIGQNQIAFIDRGAKDGLSVGTRLLVVTRGDAWRHTLKTASSITRSRVRTDVPEHVQVEDTPLAGEDKDYPEEVIGELRVLRADEYSSVTVVTASRREIEPGALCVARRGY